MRRINLLPPEERRRGGIDLKSRTGLLGVLLIAGSLVILLMIGLYLFYLVRLNIEQNRIAELDQQIARSNQRIAELSPFRDLQAQLEAKKSIADGIFRSRFPWDEFLQGIAFVIPPSTALDSLTAEAAAINVQAPVGQELVGAVTFTGFALPEYQNVSDFLVQMNTLRFLTNTQLNSAELDRETFAEPAISFEAASELITRVGESGAEVRIEGESAEGTEGESPENSSLSQYQASRQRDGADGP